MAFRLGLLCRPLALFPFPPAHRCLLSPSNRRQKMNLYYRSGLTILACLSLVNSTVWGQSSSGSAASGGTVIKGTVIRQSATRITGTAANSVPDINVAPAAAGNPSQAAANPAMTTGSPQQPLSEKLKRALALQFNKTPAAILNTWSQIQRTESTDDPRPEPPGPADENKLKLEAIQQQVSQFEQDVVLSQWSSAREFLESFEDPADAQKVYDHLLMQLQTIPPVVAAVATDPSGLPANVVVAAPAGVPPQDHVISDEDVIGLIQLSPGEPTDQNLQSLGMLLRKSLDQGFGLDQLLPQLEQGLGSVGGSEISGRRKAARILLSGVRPREADSFLRPIAEAIADDDVDSIVLRSELARGIYQQEGKPSQLLAAWEANQAVLASPQAQPAQRKQALETAVQLAPKVNDEVGRAWLQQSFQEHPERGIQILTGIGQLTAEGQKLSPQDTESRLEGLKLQKLAVEVLLDSAPQQAESWNRILNLLAINWQTEARFSQQFAQSSGRPVFRRDQYGNIYYASQEELRAMAGATSNQPRPIAVQDILDTRPAGDWFAMLDNGLKMEFEELLARLFLKNAEESEAFPFIEKIAQVDKRRARPLVDEFLAVWTRNHNPNEDRGNRNQYVYFFGFEQRANSIPLTRSKQQRNLKELRQWIARIRDMQLDGLDEQALVRAFTACHSTAEVYRIEDIEEVFGSIQKLQPDTVAGLVQQMRTNLSTAWRQPRVQEAQNTNRKEPDIQQEVLRGYDVAAKVTREALFEYPESWELLLAQACIQYDHNAYQQEVKKSSEYTQKQRQVFDQFAAAAKAYQQQVAELEQDEFTTEVFDLWFYASLGACDLALLDHKSLSMESQFPIIRAAMDALPGESPQIHLAQFANKLFTRMSPLKPEMKYRYLKGGFAIVGDHPDAIEARKVFEYYNDLVTEIQLQTRIDGSDVVGTEPFGLFVNLYHTEAVERESGGFAKYLQNQNSMTYAYNYGRPTNDYRDAFETAAIAALSEHFEVISVTFEDEKNLKSREAREPGWRITPYAYLLLKARGEEVDLIPPVRLDLDFLDTSGYAVLPIESKAIPVDTGAGQAEPRPLRDLKITQTLDERRSGEGKLVLEVKATGRGLIPDFPQILELTEEAFEVIETQDQGVSVSAFDPESDEIEIIAEREWLIELKAAEDAGLPKEFEFCRATASDADLSFKRYIDADLVDVEPVVALENQYGTASRAWIFWVLVGLGAVLGPASALLIILNRPKQERQVNYPRPDEITPLSVISLLKQIRREESLSGQQLGELDDSIQRIEQHYFLEPLPEAPDLERETDHWLAIAN